MVVKPISRFKRPLPPLAPADSRAAASFLNTSPPPNGIHEWSGAPHDCWSKRSFASAPHSIRSTAAQV